uniref:Sushi domain-containing protein n=1 Tax=Ciona savignyi TaxID=51511 RepID=H2YQI0_CIOSA
MCQAALTWSQTTGPTCLKECGAPPSTNLAVTSTVTTDPISGKNVEGKLITYGCLASGTALQGTATNTCQNNGQWTLPLMANTPTCDPVCPNPPAINNGTGTFAPSSGPYFASASVQYTCTTGSSPSVPGSDVLRCTTPPNWTPTSAPLCITTMTPHYTRGILQPTITTPQKDNRDLDIVYMVESNDNVEVG